MGLLFRLVVINKLLVREANALFKLLNVLSYLKVEVNFGVNFLGDISSDHFKKMKACITAM